MRKIYYFPGLISALLIPVLFWYYGNMKLEEANLRVIDIGIPAKLTGNNYLYSFEPLRNWDYKQIKVNPNTVKENSNLYVSEMKALQKRNQKETGIEFILDKNNTYGDFASLLNDMEIAKQDTYAFDIEKTGHVFAVHYYKDPNAKEVECLLCNDAIYTYAEPTFKDKFFKLPKEAFFIIFGFLLFLNISMFSIKENLQTKRTFA
ncbi:MULTISPECIES: hypothetical protein [Chryseobacterium]|uniref:Uncharacterized protein n=1 Tax=Candidatus Chryseobacterium massiliense TaxID=204089 RepID=A0A3D9BGB9_9FLAO|nr:MULTISPECIES: hypothetical protein [Chryseobacterium]REC52585.1 hypothetical protein DRF68_02350 [Candidatus Chryseobacterium massiliae]